MTGGLVPFAFSGEEPKELAYSLEPSLSYNRKRDFRHSEDSNDTVNKRLHEYTDGQEPDSDVWRVASSPPSIDHQYLSSELVDAFAGNAMAVDLSEDMSEDMSEDNAPGPVPVPAGRTSSVSTITAATTRLESTQSTTNTTPSMSLRSRIVTTYDVGDLQDTEGAFDMDQYLGTNRTKAYQKALETIQRCVDNALPVLNLESIQLRRIPDDIGDLKNMVLTSLDQPLIPDIHVFLQNNLISKIPQQLFDVTNISVLSLRNNQIRCIPPNLRKLVNLKNLSLGGNELEYLPSELLELKKLEVLSIHPNPFMKAEEGAEPSGVDVPTRYAVSTLMPARNGGGIISNCPTLLESCLSMLSTLVITNGDRSRWELEPRISRMLDTAIEQRTSGVCCGICNRPVIHGLEYVYEWWTGVVGNKQVPLKRYICSYTCEYKQKHNFR